MGAAMADKPIVLGIDLGTTNTCVAYVRNKIAKVVPSDKGALILPSVVALSEKGDLLIGNVAKDQMVTNPRNTIYGCKRLIGRKYNSKVVQDIKHYFSYEIVEGPEGEASVVLGGRIYSLPQISGFVLQHCKRVAEATLGQEIHDAIISVPAYYNDNQRQAVKVAGKLAGFNVRRIVNEPTAAALAYGLNRGFDHKVLVYDLGGGTFDVSILQLHGNVMEVLATGGDTFLGGVDFDNRIIDHVLEEFRGETKIDLTQSPISMQRLKNAAEAAKIDLSLLSNVVIELPFIYERKGKPVDLRMPLSRERLNLLVMDLVEKTFELCDRVLREANLQPTDIAETLLVGGQTRMPLVQGKAHQHFGRPPRKGVHPDESVALGAALLAESMQEIDSVTLVDALSMPIGFATPNGRFRKVIEKNSQIPTVRSFRLPPPREAGAALELDIFQGENERILDNEYLGTLRFPAEAAGQRVHFNLDEECLLRVTVDGTAGEPKEVQLATLDTPDALRTAWAEENERRRSEQLRQEAESAPPRGLFATLRDAFRSKG
jgi:molecular chaperone DnaK